MAQVVKLPLRACVSTRAAHSLIGHRISLGLRRCRMPSVWLLTVAPGGRRARR